MPSRRRMLGRLGTLAAVPAFAPVAAGDRRGSSDGTAGVEWKRTFGDGDFQCRDVVETEAGVLLVGRTGSNRSADPWLAEVGEDGEPRWRKTIDAPGFTEAVDAVPSGDGYTVLLTTDEGPPLLLDHLDGEGERRWRRRAEGPNRHGIQTLARSGKGYLVGGLRGYARHLEGDLEAWLRAVDREGGTRWERRYDASVVADVRPWSDGVLLAGRADDAAWVQAVAPDGTPRWRHTYGGVEREQAAVAVPAGRGVLYGGTARSVTERRGRGMLVRTTGDGGFAWRRTLDLLHVVDLVPYGDGYAVTGEPPRGDRSGRNPEKPVVTVDRWGRVGNAVTVDVDPGAPVGLGRFDDGALAIGGWDGDEGVWLAKVRPD